MIADPLLPSLLAVTNDDPDARARMTTVGPKIATIRATVESLVDHDTNPPERMVPLESRSVATNDVVSPAGTIALSGVTVTVATESPGGGGGGAESVTTSRAVPVPPRLDADTRVVP